MSGGSRHPTSFTIRWVHDSGVPLGFEDPSLHFQVVYDRPDVVCTVQSLPSRGDPP
jgi:hypothetical protein